MEPQELLIEAELHAVKLDLLWGYACFIGVIKIIHFQKTIKIKKKSKEFWCICVKRTPTHTHRLNCGTDVNLSVLYK